MLFQQRYEEGYNLFDLEYMRWLEVHHPADDVPCNGHHLMSVSTSPSTTKSVVGSFTSVVPLLILTSPPFPGDALTVASEFPHTPPSGAGLSSTPPSGVGDLKYISKCLIQYVSAPQKKAEAKWVGGE